VVGAYQGVKPPSLSLMLLYFAVDDQPASPAQCLPSSLGVSPLLYVSLPLGSWYIPNPGVIVVGNFRRLTALINTDPFRQYYVTVEKRIQHLDRL
jgi:hypothetical protein